MMENESWIRLSIFYPIPDEERFELYLFEQETYAALYSYGAATINEQDPTTLDGKDLPPDTKALQCYFTSDQAVEAAEVRSAIEQIARQNDVAATTQIEAFSDDSWKDGWKAYFKPAQVSPRLAIRTPWCEFTAPEGVKTIVIEPGMAFGTGLHETTQLCIRQIDEISKNGDIASMLDIGCGSGVLSIAGALCGIAHVEGIDIDPVCIEVSEKNARANGVTAHFSRTDLWDVDSQFDLVVANIISSVLKSLCDDMVAVMKPSGVLVLSGILVEELGEVKANFTNGMNLAVVETHIMGEWASICLKKLN